jgi:hypothetical protein
MSPAFGGVCPDESLEPNGDPSQAVNVPTLTVDVVAPKIVRPARPRVLYCAPLPLGQSGGLRPSVLGAEVGEPGERLLQELLRGQRLAELIAGAAAGGEELGP